MCLLIKDVIDVNRYQRAKLYLNSFVSFIFIKKHGFYTGNNKNKYCLEMVEDQSIRRDSELMFGEFIKI